MRIKQREPLFRWHWQNLSKCDDKRHCKAWPVNGRAWFHVLAWTIHIEWHLWSRSFRFGVDLDQHGDDAVLLSFALPPISLYLGIGAPWKSWFRGILPSSGRHCQIAIHDWAIWLHPWCRDGEWRSADPWWVRGVTFHIDDFLLGKIRYSDVEIAPPRPVVIHLDGFVYGGIATFHRRRWKRPRWFAMVRESTEISMSPGHGLPHSGKGENSWDCGDDALYGWGVEGIDVDKAITHGVETVQERRRRYGQPSRLGPTPETPVCS